MDDSILREYAQPNPARRSLPSGGAPGTTSEARIAESSTRRYGLTRVQPKRRSGEFEHDRQTAPGCRRELAEGNRHLSRRPPPAGLLRRDCISPRLAKAWATSERRTGSVKRDTIERVQGLVRRIYG